MQQPSEKPVLFSAAMMCAIRANRKGQTRRVVKRSTHPAIHHWSVRASSSKRGEWEAIPHGANAEVEKQYITTFPLARRAPYGGPGGHLWVRETWAGANSEGGPLICYRADCGRRYLMEENDMLETDGSMDYSKTGNVDFSHWAADLENDGKGWKPSIHMPRWASRESLKITGLRIERLNAISEADAIAEGVEPVDGLIGPGFLNYCHEGPGTGYFAGATAATDSYASLWEKINGAGSWKANPWVWVIEFDRVKS